MNGRLASLFWTLPTLQGCYAYNPTPYRLLYQDTLLYPTACTCTVYLAMRLFTCMYCVPLLLFKNAPLYMYCLGIVVWLIKPYLHVFIHVHSVYMYMYMHVSPLPLIRNIFILLPNTMYTVRAHVHLPSWHLYTCPYLHSVFPNLCGTSCRY